MKILLIEPDRVLAQTYHTYLTQNGHDVTHAEHAQAAIQALDSIEPRAIVLELQLPGHNGVEFLYELRSYGDLQHIPVIAHTLIGPGDFAQSEGMLQALGVVAYLYKPATSLQTLGRTLADVLEPASS